MIYIILLLLLLVVPAAADQAYLLTGLGNLFVVEMPVSVVFPNGTVNQSPQTVRIDADVFFVTGRPHDAQPVLFDSVYHPGISYGDAVHGMVSGTPHTSVVPGHGPYAYRNGIITSSTAGLDHTLDAPLPRRIYEGAQQYWHSSQYTIFQGNGTAVYSLSGEPQHMLAERVCHAQPCGSITLARSHRNLLLYPGDPAGAPLYDTIHLGAHPTIISNQHYVIAETAAGAAGMRAVPYDYNKFEVRGMPAGTAYIMTPNDGSYQEWWDAHALHGCCYSPHHPAPHIRAGLQVSGDTISYPSTNGTILFLSYPGTLWGEGPGWLLFDHHNGQAVKFAGPAKLVLAGTYVRIPYSTQADISDVIIAQDCAAGPRRTLAYLAGQMEAGGHIMVPVVPGYPVVCIISGGLQSSLPVQGITEGDRTAAFEPRHLNVTGTDPPRILPCTSCGHDLAYADMQPDASSHVGTIAAHTGTLILDIDAQTRYDLSLQRTWSSDRPHDISHWSPQTTTLDAGGAHVSVYRNGHLADTHHTACDAESSHHTSHTTYRVGSVYVYGWTWEYTHTCTTQVAARLHIPAEAGDIIDVIIRADPRILARTAAHDASGITDTTTHHTTLGGLVVKSYQ